MRRVNEWGTEVISLCCCKCTRVPCASVVTSTQPRLAIQLQPRTLLHTFSVPPVHWPAADSLVSMVVLALVPAPARTFFSSATSSDKDGPSLVMLIFVWFDWKASMATST